MAAGGYKQGVENFFYYNKVRVSLKIRTFGLT